MEKIFIEDGLSLYKKTGIGQYTENLANLLSELGYDVIMPRKHFMEKIKNASIKRFLYVIWLNTIFPFIVLLSGAKKIIFSNTMTPFIRFPKKEFYPILYDFWSQKFPETMSKVKRDYQNFIIKTIEKTATKILTDSNTVKQEIIDFYNCDNEFVKVIYCYFSFGEKPELSSSEEYQVNLLKKYGIGNKKYILSVANLNKRKNLQSLAEAYDKLNTDIKLVLVGVKQNEEFPIKNSNIIFTGYISDEDIKILYKNSLIYAFPSLYEGFGIPLIDAQSFGVPVLCSDIPIFHEIGDNSVFYCQTDSIGIKECLETLLCDSKLQQDLVKSGFENIKKYSKNCIKEQIINALH